MKMQRVDKATLGFDEDGIFLVLHGDDFTASCQRYLDKKVEEPLFFPIEMYQLIELRKEIELCEE